MPTSLFVTGASSGIGAALLEAVPDGYGEPHTFSRRPSPGRWTGADLGDPGQWPAVTAAVEAALDAERPEHAVLLHVSGTTDPVGRAVDQDPAAYASVVVLNAAAGPVLGQAFLRACRARGVRATLVLVSSPAAHKDSPGLAQYCAGKGGLEHWGRIVALEVDGSGDRVVTVVPYAVLTDIVRDVMTRDPDEVPLVGYFRAVEAAGEFATPQECAAHVWDAVASASNGDVVPVGALVIARRSAVTA